MILELQIQSKIHQSSEFSHFKEAGVLTVNCKVEFLLKLLDTSRFCDGISESSSFLSNLNPVCARES